MDQYSEGRGNPWDYDPGPPRNRKWPRLFSEAPNYRALGKAVTGSEKFRWHHGPMFYRGRLGDNQVRVLVIGQEGGQDEALSHRSFTGSSGSRMQHFLNHIGITTSYLFLNTFVYSIFGQYSSSGIRWLAQDPESPICRHRDELLDYAAERNDLHLVVAVGNAAKESVRTWVESRGASGPAGVDDLDQWDGTSIGPKTRLLGVVHPGGAASGNLAAIKADFQRAADLVEGWAQADPEWLPEDTDGTRHPAADYRYEKVPIPFADLPFGVAWRLGYRSTTSNRKDSQQGIQMFSAGGKYNNSGHSLTYMDTGNGSSTGYDQDPADLAYEPPIDDYRAFDRGPGPSMARLLMGGRAGYEWPDFTALGSDAHPSFGMGPIYRGRPEDATLIVLADQRSYDDLFTCRALTGEAGQHLTRFLAAAGVDESYVIFRVLAIDTKDASTSVRNALVDDPQVRKVYRRILDTAASANNRRKVVLAVGPMARRMIADVAPTSLPVLEMKAWGQSGAAADWQDALDTLSGLTYGKDRSGPSFQFDPGRGQIPRRDLPYGVPRWQGTSGDRALKPKRGAKRSPDYFKLMMPRWAFDLDPRAALSVGGGGRGGLLMPDPIFDPLAGPKWVLDGRIVPMTGSTAIVNDGRIYIDGGKIVAVQEADAPHPEGFEGVKVLSTGGTIYPGMVELHNHLAYNVLPLWNVPKPYTNRDQWGRHKDYRRLISGPMSVLGRTDGLVQAVVRWAEAKCLVGGTTTSQGVALYSNAGITKYYRGLVRNVEETNDPELPEASTRIGDVEAGSGSKFLARLESHRNKGKKLILHLAEGTDDRANDHFRALKIDDRRWAINEALVGIHGTGLRSRNFRTMAVRGGSVVWSPLSNLLLYGNTTDVRRAIDDEVTVALGSDWSPSGSKNLLIEMKVARAWCDTQDLDVSDYEIVQMVTSNPAAMVGWGAAVGTIEPGKRADFVVLGGKSGDPYAKLIAARESTVALVVINGVRRYGQTRFLRDIDGVERRTIADASRVFNLTQEGVEESMVDLSVEEAESRLRSALIDLPSYAKALEDGALMGLATAGDRPKQVVVGAGASLPGLEGNWYLELDHVDALGVTQRPKLRTDERIRTGVFGPSEAASVPLSELLGSIRLDDLAAPDDEVLWDTLALEQNLPHPVKKAIFRGYSRKAPPPVETARQAIQVEPAVATTPEPGEGPLTRRQRLEIVRQALLLLEHAYVHLRFKQAHHAVDPVQRLRLLEHRLEHQHEDELDDELVFHNEMTRIFSSVRDLHTVYVLPRPYQQYRAVLPFLVEECFEQEGERQVPHYVVTRVAPDAEHPTFATGAEILHWNGLPIRVAIEQNAALQAGGNPAAAFARGLQALTVRPLMVSLPPAEDWVTITYRDVLGEVRQVRKEWVFERITTPLFSSFESAVETAVGLDLRAYEVGKARKWLFARPVAEAEFAAKTEQLDEAMVSRGASLGSTMPGIFKAKLVDEGRKGHLRIYTFMTDDVDAFVGEFERLVQALPQEGLVIDVRGNGGGVIHAAERLLQLLTDRQISPSRAQFASTDLMLDICRRHAPSAHYVGLSFEPWVTSLGMSVTTGETYSRAFPITPEDAANENRGYVYPGPVVLVVDALCYSATDIFAAGFIDHEIGEVLGTSDNTGAGGANVWTHSILRTLAGPDAGLTELPNDAAMRVSVRRVVRVGDADGQILEDIGISTDGFHRHHLTRNDIEFSNEDLIAAAVKLLDG